MTTFNNYQAPFPSGAIIPWTGTLSNLPVGWVVCDGNNGTPSLNNKFIKSVPDTTTDPGTTGGNASYNMGNGQLASHSHNGNTSNNGGHGHNITYSDGNNGSSFGNGTHMDAGNGSTVYTTASGNHTHNTNTNSTGGNSSINNEPKYTETLYIQKI